MWTLKSFFFAITIIGGKFIKRITLTSTYKMKTTAKKTIWSSTFDIRCGIVFDGFLVIVLFLLRLHNFIFRFSVLPFKNALMFVQSFAHFVSLCVLISFSSVCLGNDFYFPSNVFCCCCCGCFSFLQFSLPFLVGDRKKPEQGEMEYNNDEGKKVIVGSCVRTRALGAQSRQNVHIVNRFGMNQWKWL